MRVESPGRHARSELRHVPTDVAVPAVEGRVDREPLVEVDPTALADEEGAVGVGFDHQALAEEIVAAYSTSIELRRL
jgi:hypothetical protein